MASAMRVNLCRPRVLGVAMSRVVGWFSLSAMLTSTLARYVPLDLVRMDLRLLKKKTRNAVQVRDITGLLPVVFSAIHVPLSSQTCAVEVLQRCVLLSSRTRVCG
ncbi:hypothetical protein QR685DRAFT_64380 [Neurospora intermedia]|uniref:Secreted protein n=1 Tax=Neurospora intermedia TaxID=5142 RepID=A0ABR3DTD3_NEUIN